MRAAGINLLCALGVGACLYGMWAAYPPLAWMAGGAFACWLGVVKYQETEKA